MTLANRGGVDVKEKNGDIFFTGEVFFLLTSPLMGDPSFFPGTEVALADGTGVESLPHEVRILLHRGEGYSSGVYPVKFMAMTAKRISLGCGPFLRNLCNLRI